MEVTKWRRSEHVYFLRETIRVPSDALCVADGEVNGGSLKA